MTALHRRRLLALLATCALIATTAQYAAHDLGARGHSHEHCDLCVHLAGSAGSRAAPLPPLATATTWVYVAQALPPRRTFFFPRGARLARAPPPLAPG
ncbi:MAG: hypothetical protein JOZ67_03170 [Gammaproteobacteria bacterium]|nr:hypothetical protein [Gammaproteobacteria bacterium]MBV9698171.1 hypothetical protein [Gammaproteobacteria bacterium]